MLCSTTPLYLVMHRGPGYLYLYLPVQVPSVVPLDGFE